MNGIKISNAEYHTRPEISKSDLDLLAKSPYHYKHKGEFESPESKSLILGSAVHKLVLENADFCNEFAIAPDVDRRTKAGKEAYAEFEANAGNKIVIDSSTFEQARAIAAAVLDKKITSEFSVGDLLSDGHAEMSYFSELDGVAVKCRPDFYNEKLRVVVDLKTTADASKDGFARSCGAFNYHVQAAFYSDILRNLGAQVSKFCFIAVEKTAPFMVGFYELDPVALDLGRDTYKKLLARFKTCSELNNWWGYAEFDESKNELNALQTITLPNWKFYESIND